MSGICAVWRKEEPAKTAGTLECMSRGLLMDPAERVSQNTGSGAGVAVSSRFATQQIYGDERVLVACDADLSNAPELEALCGANRPAPENAKTAALLAALYCRLGSAFVAKLNGNFSLVVWDLQERKLLAAVDGFGVNRLVYFQNGRMIVVASRIDSLLHTGEIAPEVNPRAIANFMNFGVNLAPETVFRGIERLQPGTLLLSSKARTSTDRYWNMRYGSESGASEKLLSRQLESVVETAVTSHSKKDGSAGLGAFLSGGTDSSTVVGMMSRTGTAAVKAFSIGFEEQQFNELSYAEMTAKRFQAEHYTYLVGAYDCCQALPQMVRFFDEPFANSSAIPTYFCARLAAENSVTALLAGDGGDELFGGNERYATDKIFHLYQGVPKVLRKGLIEPVLDCLPSKGMLGTPKSYVRRSNMPPVERFYSYNFLCAHPPQEIFQQDFLTRLAGYSVLDIPARYYREAPARDHLDRLLYLDVKITLGDSDLPKVTQMAELAGIQVRFPFLDRAVAEFSGAIPPRLKVNGFEKRYLFKKAFRSLLPPEVLRKKKHGFGIPVSTWLKTDRRLREMARDTVFSARAIQRGYFRKEFLEDLIRKHETDNTSYYGDTLWSFLVLELWHRQFVDRLVGVAA